MSEKYLKTFKSQEHGCYSNILLNFSFEQHYLIVCVFNTTENTVYMGPRVRCQETYLQQCYIDNSAFKK